MDLPVPVEQFDTNELERLARDLEEPDMSPERRRLVSFLWEAACLGGHTLIHVRLRAYGDL
jgi:hypothetical protein